MNKVAIYPGTFDPITFGHIDVIKKGLKLFDKIVVAVSDVDNKNYLFNSDERIEIDKKALFSDLKLNKKKISIISFTSEYSFDFSANNFLSIVPADKSFSNEECLDISSSIVLLGIILTFPAQMPFFQLLIQLFQ